MAQPSKENSIKSHLRIATSIGSVPTCTSHGFSAFAAELTRITASTEPESLATTGRNASSYSTSIFGWKSPPVHRLIEFDIMAETVKPITSATQHAGL
ncbi:MAG: hypothetical protein NTW52_18590 [Planctomycetota bacterium]|nr:hypothetical protein [Planctomycetota bacterium]